MAAESRKKEPESPHCITYVSTFLMLTQQYSSIALVNLYTCFFFVFFFLFSFFTKGTAIQQPNTVSAVAVRED